MLSVVQSLRKLAPLRNGLISFFFRDFFILQFILKLKIFFQDCHHFRFMKLFIEEIHLPRMRLAKEKNLD